MPHACLDIVTPGWELPGWDADFYPSDLPPDWRLTYFANEHPAVLLAAHLWSAPHAVAALETWRGDVPAGFRFYLGLPAGGAGEDQLGRARGALGETLAGLVASSPAVRPAAAGVPVFVEVSGPASVTDESLPAACRAPAAASGDLAADRAWLDAFAGRVGSAGGLVILDGPGLRAADVARWWRLAWLMGVA